jgi:nitrite reductase/ring-hydroxylating ferredoxin subunit
MNRRTFIKHGCLACVSSSVILTVLESCTVVKYGTGKLTDNGMLVNTDEFRSGDKIRDYIIIRHDDLLYPICLYRLSDNEYSAILMRCSHQGAELQVSGDRLMCPAHGSEFDKSGHVVQAPAMSDLRKFPVSVLDNKMFIDLRKEHS